MELLEDVSFMSPSGYHPNSCGYCDLKPRRSSRNYYAFSDVGAVRPAHYQGLADRGWRRSGTTWYKPDVKNACCPHYTIRPRKDQRKAVNQFNDFVLGVEYKRRAARLCPKSRQEKKFRRNNFPLCEAVHQCEYTCIKRPVDPSTKETIEPEHTLEVTLEPDTFTSEKYALFAHYQKVVHKDPPSRISRDGFKSFLCSGMKQSMYTGDGKPRQVGSFHQCYRLDGRLIAIGVLDLLPNCISSVYLIYHEDVSQWELGKISALREIALAIEGGYPFYYMGYYIHDCVKMRYKRTFRPTYVLDPETYSWDLLDDDVAARMSVRKYVSVSREARLGLETPTEDELAAAAATVQDKGSGTDVRPSTVFDADMPGLMTKAEVASQVSLDDIKVLQGNKIFSLGHIPDWGLDTTDRRSPLLPIAEFMACIGPELASRIVIDISS